MRKVKRRARPGKVSKARARQAVNQDDHLLSEREAAQLLRCNRITLMRARQDGRIRYYKIGTRILYNRQTLLADLEQNAKQTLLANLERNAKGAAKAA